ncbi:MAG: NAD(P)/FAD-dependent oxidoreductase [Candidatus Methanofastidiosia archaeon]|jgi:digeranylgeranylglycerophospholipid reductase
MDVIVVGAGPAGSMAAKAVAEAGFTVTVYEKGPLKREKPCGGGVSDRVKKEFHLKESDDFWERYCEGIFLCSPGNTTILMKEIGRKGYFVMRETFDYYLVQKAQKEGAEFVENRHVTPFVEHGKVKGVKTKDDIIKADIVIACDGTPSTFARELGIYARDDYNQAVTYQYQMKMDNTEIDEKIGDAMEIYFGHKWMPYGYSWIFPKQGKVTVGCGTWLYAVKDYNINVKRYLDTFIAQHPVASKKLENAKILYPQSGMMGFPGIVNTIYLDNFMLAGDAAGFVSVPTGEGIYYSMVTGKIAGEVAATALKHNDTTKHSLKKYKQKTDKKIGSDMKWGYWLRRLVMDNERNQEQLIRASLKDAWIRKKTGYLIGGDIGYKQYLIHYLLRPDKLLKLWIS